MLRQSEPRPDNKHDFARSTVIMWAITIVLSHGGEVNRIR